MKADVFWIVIQPGQVIAPQPDKYWIEGGSPLRIGDQTYISIPSKNYRVKSPIIKVILLADPSGRQWLVECK